MNYNRTPGQQVVVDKRTLRYLRKKKSAKPNRPKCFFCGEEVRFSKDCSTSCKHEWMQITNTIASKGRSLRNAFKYQTTYVTKQMHALCTKKTIEI